jgi:hypothetical protein
MSDLPEGEYLIEIKPLGSMDPHTVVFMHMCFEQCAADDQSLVIDEEEVQIPFWAMRALGLQSGDNIEWSIRRQVPVVAALTLQPESWHGLEERLGANDVDPVVLMQEALADKYVGVVEGGRIPLMLFGQDVYMSVRSIECLPGQTECHSLRSWDSQLVLKMLPAVDEINRKKAIVKTQYASLRSATEDQAANRIQAIRDQLTAAIQSCEDTKTNDEKRLKSRKERFGYIQSDIDRTLVQIERRFKKCVDELDASSFEHRIAREGASLQDEVGRIAAAEHQHLQKLVNGTFEQ